MHVFGRRGPAQVKFTPLELRELSPLQGRGHHPLPEDFEFDEDSDAARSSSNNQTKTMVGTLTNWIAEQPEDLSELTASRRLHLHFLHSPVEIYDDAETPGRVAGIKFERTELDGTGNVRGTGEFVDYPVQAVYRAIGYFGSAAARGRVRPQQGRRPERRRPRPGRRRQPRPGHLRHRLDQARPGRA